MKKILSLLIVLLSSIGNIAISFAAGELQGDLTGRIQEVIPQVGAPNQDLNYIDIAEEIQFWVFVFIGVIAVAYIIYIGAKLLWAPGNTEQITTALKSLAYIVV